MDYYYSYINRPQPQLMNVTNFAVRPEYDFDPT